MTETLTLPIWVVVVAGALVLWAVLDRLLVPSTRWPAAFPAYTARTQTDFRRLDATTRVAAIKRLGHDVFGAIAAAIPVLPVPLIATVFVHHPHTALSALEIKAHAQTLIDALSQLCSRHAGPRIMSGAGCGPAYRGGCSEAGLLLLQE